MTEDRIGLLTGITESNNLYDRAKKVIGSGTNTFSRAPGVFPDGAAPKFLSHQSGCRTWDVDGNQYIDMVMGCGPVTLGHRHPAIDDAIRAQLDRGILFSMLHPLEVEVAEKLVDCIPYAEMVKFSKNGSDVCAAAVRLARHVTGRNMVFCWGYHGFHDWYVASTDRSAGIPEEIKNLTKTFEYGDPEALRRALAEHKGEVAAIILEPVIGQKPICSAQISNGRADCRSSKMACASCPQREFLSAVKEIAKEEGALLIFDEMISGFRFAMGGAGQYFGVEPDLATFGKGITNGMPLGVLAGKAEHMRHFDRVFLSSTYAPETLTLAAASANIDFYRSHNVIESLWEKGESITAGFEEVIDRYHLRKNVSLAGYPVRLMVNTHDSSGLQDPKLASLYQQEMFKRGILCFSGVLMLSYSHAKEDLDLLIEAFDGTCAVIAEFFESGRSIDEILECVPGAPVFKGLRERNAVSN